jgi:hypothetical protein
MFLNYPLFTTNIYEKYSNVNLLYHYVHQVYMQVYVLYLTSRKNVLLTTYM